MKRELSKAEYTKAFNAIKLLKTVYEDMVFVSGRNVPITAVFDHIGSPGTNKIFRRSYFSHMVELLPVELAQSFMSIQACYEAFKNKCMYISTGDDYVTLTNGDKSYTVANRLSKEEADTIMLNLISWFFEYNDEEIAKLGDTAHYSGTTCEYSVIERLIRYETVTIREDENSDIGIILTAKCFPNIKKCGMIQINWLWHDGEEQFTTCISSAYPDNIIFRMVVETLRC